MLYTLCLKMNQDSNPVKLYMSLIISCSPSIFKLFSCQVCRQVALRNNCMVVDCPHRISMVTLCILSASSLREMKYSTSAWRRLILLRHCSAAVESCDKISCLHAHLHVVQHRLHQQTPLGLCYAIFFPAVLKYKPN